MDDLVIIGVGGWGRGVHNIMEAANEASSSWNFLGFLESDITMHGQEVHGYPVLGGLEWLRGRPQVAVSVGIGNSAARRKVTQALHPQYPNPFATVIHPRAWIGNRVSIGEGTVIHANCIITTDLRVGAHVVLNLNSSLTHDDIIEDYVTIQPGVAISGSVHVGEGTEIGTGSSVIQGVRIGAWSRIGAGAAVIRDIPSHVTAVGVPAKPVKELPKDWYEVA